MAVEATRELTTLYLRGIPRRLVREAKAEAARRGATLARLVSDAVAAALQTDAEGDDLTAAMAWYRQHEQRLVRRYHGEYVAILDGRVVDHDVHFAPLAERVFRTHGDRPVYVPRVGDGSRTVRVRSPRLVG